MKKHIVPQVKERIEIIKEINFEKAADNDLLGEYLAIDSLDQRLKHILIMSRLYFSNAE
jgi:hypothetical protein